jgi:hypothetical protein
MRARTAAPELKRLSSFLTSSPLSPLDNLRLLKRIRRLISEQGLEEGKRRFLASQRLTTCAPRKVHYRIQRAAQ